MLSIIEINGHKEKLKRSTTPLKKNATDDCTRIKHVPSMHLFPHLIINGYVFLQMYKTTEVLLKTWKIRINVNALNFHMLTDNIQVVFNDFFNASAIFLLLVPENLVVHYLYVLYSDILRLW